MKKNNKLSTKEFFKQARLMPGYLEAKMRERLGEVIEKDLLKEHFDYKV